MFMAIHGRPDPMAASRLMDLLDQAQVIQGFQCPVNACYAWRVFEFQGLLIDLLGRKRARGGGDDPHHLEPGLGDP